jgi:hypothetical protein
VSEGLGFWALDRLLLFKHPFSTMALMTLDVVNKLVQSGVVWSPLLLICMNRLSSD